MINNEERKEPAREGADRDAASEQACQCGVANKSMAESVTRHALISHVDNIEYLTCGIDSLDVGFYVSWGASWEELRETFDVRKE
jgi:hypothetical protein